MSPLPKHLREKPSTPQTRGRAKEHQIAQALKGRTTVNSGATFGENDVIADYCEVEVKLTTRSSFSLKAEYLREVRDKCSSKKIPMMILNFENHGDTYGIISLEDLKFIIEEANKPKLKS